MVDTNTKIQIINTNKSLLETSAISNGSIYFVQDTKELFYDYNSIRSSITDILILATEADRTSVLFTPLNKFYFVLYNIYHKMFLHTYKILLYSLN